MNTAELQEAIGFPPNNGSLTSTNLLASRINVEPKLRSSIIDWLAVNGIPVDSATRSSAASLAKAYCNRRYLEAWRINAAPNFKLLQATSAKRGGEFELLEEDDDDNAPTKADFEDKGRAFSNTLADGTANKAQSEAWLKSLFAQIETTVAKLVQEKIANAKLTLDDGAKEQIRQLAKITALDEVNRLTPPRQIVIHNTETNVVTNIGLQHEKFPLLLKAAQARDHKGNRLNIWLTGPTGSGKTSAAEAVAKALSLPFGSDGSLDADYKVLGFRDANGNIISTQFLQIYENGGIYVADEIDNWQPSALLSLNAALANGWVSCPKGMIPRHKDCIVIACANTWGLGATNEYVGRSKLDAASLDRFQPKIEWPIDEKLEAAVAQAHGGELGLDWHSHIISARARAKAQGLKVIISPRSTFGGIALLKQGFDFDEVKEMTFLSGLSAEQKKVIASIDTPVSGPNIPTTDKKSFEFNRRRW